MHEMLHVFRRGAPIQPRNDGASLKFVFVGVRLKIDPLRVVPKENSRHLIEKNTVRGLQPATSLLPFAHFALVHYSGRPNGFRLSGARKGVRCSRGLGACF